MNIVGFLTVFGQPFNPRYWGSDDGFLNTGFFCVEDVVEFD